jgi:hypothetical protein
LKESFLLLAPTTLLPGIWIHKTPTHPKKPLLKQKEKTDNPDQDNEQQSLHGSTWVCGKRERERERERERRWVGFALENDGIHGLYVCVCERERGAMFWWQK